MATGRGEPVNGRNFQLADLLTAGGIAMGAANLRLTAAGAPALLRSYDLTLIFPGTFRVCPGNAGLAVIRPRSAMATRQGDGASIRINANYIAAPTLVPVPPT